MKRSLLFVLLLFSAAGLFPGQTLAQDGARELADHANSQIRVAARRLLGLVRQLHNQRRIRKYYESLPRSEQTAAGRKNLREAEFQERQIRRQMEDVIWDLKVWKEVIVVETNEEESDTTDNDGRTETLDGTTEFEQLKRRLLDAEPDSLSGVGGTLVRNLVIAGLKDPANARHVRRLMKDQDFRNKLRQFRESPGGRKLIQEMRQDPSLGAMLDMFQIDNDDRNRPHQRHNTSGIDNVDDNEFLREFKNGGTVRLQSVER